MSTSRMSCFIVDRIDKYLMKMHEAVKQPVKDTIDARQRIQLMSDFAVLLQNAHVEVRAKGMAAKKEEKPAIHMEVGFTITLMK